MFELTPNKIFAIHILIGIIKFVSIFAIYYLANLKYAKVYLIQGRLMKKSLISSFCLFFIISNSSNVFAQNNNYRSQSYNQKVINEIKTELNQLERRYINQLDSSERRLAITKIDNIYNLLKKLNINRSNSDPFNDDNSIKDPFKNGGNSYNDPFNDRRREVKVPMNEDDFYSLYKNISEVGFKSEKNNIIRLAARSNYFSIKQVLRILSRFNFDQDKLFVLKFIYPKVVDKKNAYQLLESFAFSNSKLEVNRIIEKNKGY